jgi:hypothetical protein
MTNKSSESLIVRKRMCTKYCSNFHNHDYSEMEPLRGVRNVYGTHFNKQGDLGTKHTKKWKPYHTKNAGRWTYPNLATVRKQNKNI